MANTDLGRKMDNMVDDSVGHPGWDEFYNVHEVGRYPPEALIRFVAGHFYEAENRADVRILEIGCGSGPNLWYLAREGFSATGIDGSRVGLERARTYLESEGFDVQLDCGTVTGLPYPDNYFDGVVDLECLSALNMNDAQIAISEIHRVLKPGGVTHSQAFALGTTMKGRRVEEHAHTYEVEESPFFLRRFGVHRLTTEEEIPILYQQFENVEYEYMINSRNGRLAVCKQWLITGHKAKS